MSSRETKYDTTKVSFEVFPPRDEVGQEALFRCAKQLRRFSPSYVSVTYGADGGDRNQTLDTMRALKSRTGLSKLAGHISCVGASREQVIQTAQEYASEASSEWCVALRGDSPNGAHASFEPHPDGFVDAPELVAGLKEKTRMNIAVGGYPEPHPASKGADFDMDHLKRKIDAGADAIITQFFFENEFFLSYRDKCQAAGIDIPIIPGIMPIKNFAAIARFSRRCGASIPKRLAERFERAKECGAEKELALAVCAGQCDDLRNEGVTDFHFYTLNDAMLSVGTCRALGLDPSAPIDGEDIQADTLAISA